MPRISDPPISPKEIWEYATRTLTAFTGTPRSDLLGTDEPVSTSTVTRLANLDKLDVRLSENFIGRFDPTTGRLVYEAHIRTPINLAYNKPTMPSADTQSVDGNLGTATPWYSFEPETVAHYIDLGQVRNSFLWIKLGGYASNATYAGDIKVYISDDAATWVVVWGRKFTETAEYVMELDLNFRRARYIGVGGWGYSGYPMYVRIYEIICGRQP